GAIEQLLGGDALLIPTLLGAPVSFTIFDLGSGFVLFEGEFEPPADDGSTTELPPALYADQQPPLPVGASPVRLLRLTAEAGRTGTLGPGLSYVVTDDSLAVTGSASSAPAGLKVRLIGLDDTLTAFTTAGTDGAFSIDVPVTVGHRYLLAIGARITGETALRVEFSEAMAAGFVGLDVRDASG